MTTQQQYGVDAATLDDIKQHVRADILREKLVPEVSAEIARELEAERAKIRREAAEARRDEYDAEIARLQRYLAELGERVAANNNEMGRVATEWLALIDARGELWRQGDELARMGGLLVAGYGDLVGDTRSFESTVTRPIAAAFGEVVPETVNMRPPLYLSHPEIARRVRERIRQSAQEAR